MKVISKNTEYEFSPDELKEIIANKLGIEKERVHVDYIVEHKYDDGDWRAEFAGTYLMTKVLVTVNEIK
jgi:hypothetical protein